jgi:MerR family copper efflux transcriptional regulator
MYIGELARLSGTTPKAIRHYEALGLLGKVRRSGVYRVYGAQELAQLSLIRQAQFLGFKLSELAVTFAGDAGQPDWLGLSRQIQEKRLTVQAEICRLSNLDQQLAEINVEILSCLANEVAALPAEAPCSLPDTSGRSLSKK